MAAQVGINTTAPTATFDVNGNVRFRNIPTGSASDSLVVTNNGHIRKIALKDIQINNSVCPELIKEVSSPHYLRFKSTSSIPSPNNPLTISGLNFNTSGGWIDNNTYYYSWSNTSGSPLNLNNFIVDFINMKCSYSK